jgi:hypothetical protein
MFDLNSEDLWMGEPLGRKPRTKSIRRVYRQKPKTRIVYVERPRTKRRTYQPKQKQYSVNDYASATYKGAKIAYKGTKKTIKFVSKIGKRLTDKNLPTLKQKLGGSIYGKERWGKK